MRIRRLPSLFLAFAILGIGGSSDATESFVPRVISITPELNQGLDVRLSVPHDRKYAIQATADFLNWNEFGANVATNGIFHFLDERVSVAMFTYDECPQFGPCIHPGPVYSIHPEWRFYRLMDLSEPQTIKGRVVNRSGSPIAGATISMVGAEQSAVTDDLGEFTFQAPTTLDSVARVFVADAAGYVHGIAQPSYAGTTPELDFHLEAQTAAGLTPESLEGRTLIFAQQASAVPSSISFTNNYKTDSGIYYVAARSGNRFDIYEVKSSGVFQIMRLWYEFEGGGSMGPMQWFNAGEGYAITVSTSFVDTIGMIAPPQTLNDHRLDLDFFYDLGANDGPYRSRGELQLTGLNTGRFSVTNFVQGNATGSYSYSSESNVATISLFSDPLRPSQASYTLIFTSPTAGRFVYVYAAPEDGFIGPGLVGEFRNFFSLATSILVTTDLNYQWEVPYSEQMQLILGDESTGFRFFAWTGYYRYYGVYQFVMKDNSATLTLYYGIEPGGTTDEIETLQFQFSSPSAGSVYGQLRTRDSGEVKTYPITGAFKEFKRPQ